MTILTASLSSQLWLPLQTTGPLSPGAAVSSWAAAPGIYLAASLGHAELVTRTSCVFSLGAISLQPCRKSAAALARAGKDYLWSVKVSHHSCSGGHIADVSYGAQGYLSPLLRRCFRQKEGKRPLWQPVCGESACP